MHDTKSQIDTTHYIVTRKYKDEYSCRVVDIKTGMAMNAVAQTRELAKVRAIAKLKGTR